MKSLAFIQFRWTSWFDRNTLLEYVATEVAFVFLEIHLLDMFTFFSVWTGPVSNIHFLLLVNQAEVHLVSPSFPCIKSVWNFTSEYFFGIIVRLAQLTIVTSVHGLRREQNDRANQSRRSSWSQRDSDWNETSRSSTNVASHFLPGKYVHPEMMWNSLKDEYLKEYQIREKLEKWLTLNGWVDKCSLNYLAGFSVKCHHHMLEPKSTRWPTGCRERKWKSWHVLFFSGKVDSSDRLQKGVFQVESSAAFIENVR